MLIIQIIHLFNCQTVLINEFVGNKYDFETNFLNFAKAFIESVVRIFRQLFKQIIDGDI